jgi:hypothetical protein
MKQALKWIAGVCFLITAISCLAVGGIGIISGVLFLIAGGICLPPSLKFVESKLKLPLSKTVKYSLVIASWLIAALILPKDKLSASSPKKEALAPSDSKESSSANTVTDLVRKQKLDSIIALIKGEKDFKVESVLYSEDSTLKISIKTKEAISAQYFDITYNLMSIGNVSEIEVLKKGEMQSSFGLHSGRKAEDFKKQFISAWDGSCRPVEAYIKTNMNDPDSYDHERTFVTPLANGNFRIKTVFRGKNAFGAKVLNSAFAEVSPDGKVVDFKIED